MQICVLTRKVSTMIQHVMRKVENNAPPFLLKKLPFFFYRKRLNKLGGKQNNRPFWVILEEKMGGNAPPPPLSFSTSLRQTKSGGGEVFCNGIFTSGDITPVTPLVTNLQTSKGG